MSFHLSFIVKKYGIRVVDVAQVWLLQSWGSAVVDHATEDLPPLWRVVLSRNQLIYHSNCHWLSNRIFVICIACNLYGRTNATTPLTLGSPMSGSQLNVDAEYYWMNSVKIQQSCCSCWCTVNVRTWLTDWLIRPHVQSTWCQWPTVNDHCHMTWHIHYCHCVTTYTTIPVKFRVIIHQ